MGLGFRVQGLAAAREGPPKVHSPWEASGCSSSMALQQHQDIMKAAPAHSISTRGPMTDAGLIAAAGRLTCFGYSLSLMRPCLCDRLYQQMQVAILQLGAEHHQGASCAYALPPTAKAATHHGTSMVEFWVSNRRHTHAWLRHAAEVYTGG